jgi:hypothetical protein
MRSAALRWTTLALLSALPTLAAAAEARQATGKFEGKNWTFEAFGAYAFPAEVGMDDEPGYRVAVSNTGFQTEKLDRYYDREHVIDTFFADEESLVVYFHFAKNGAYRGMTYYFGSGDGCGFCYDGSVQSTVKIANGRLKGKVKLAPKPDENSWDIDLDVPIAPASHGEPLPAGGGDPGRTYLAFHAALDAADRAALAPLLPEDSQAPFKESPEEEMAAYRKDHPEKDLKVVQGWVDGERALLVVHGDTYYGKVETEVHLVREKGTWRVANEVLQMRSGG